MHITCKICNKEFNDIKYLSGHVGKEHKAGTHISKEEYYLKYIRNEGDPDGTCLECGNQTKFRGIGFSDRKGFDKYCSKRCSDNSSDKKEKFENTMLERYGVKYAAQDKDFLDKIKQTNLEKYGAEFPIQNTDIKERIVQTNLERYGFACTLKNKTVSEKANNTVKEKYGVDNISQNKKIRDKAKQTNLERYGVDIPLKLQSIQDKKKKTLLEKYGVDNIFKSKDYIKGKFEETYDRLINSDRIKNKVEFLFNKEEYSGVDKSYQFKCLKCVNTFQGKLDDGKTPRCPVCNPYINNGTSISEREIYEFVLTHCPDSISNDRTVLSGKELDIYIPSKKIAIEFNGLYWHSELSGNKTKDYHLDKYEKCNSLGIQLIQIFEDEWINKQEIVKSMILSKLGLINNKIHARKCEIKKVNNKEAGIFLNNNHIQGEINGIHYGLFSNNELISILTISKSRYTKKYDYELLRFCSKINTIIVGGFSKLLSYIKINILDNKSLISYCDIRYSNSNSYNAVGFKLINKSSPNYYYLDNNYTARVSRIKFQKHKLKTSLTSFDPNLTEWENMQINNYDRIWDCGNLVFSYNN